MQKALYYLGLACLFTHELDAVTHAEWRLLPILQSLPDATAAGAFVALHVPLFFGILWLSHHRRASIRGWTRISVAAFLAFHGVLHFSLASAPQYEFQGALSNTLILSAAGFGAAYLLTPWLRRRRAQDP